LILTLLLMQKLLSLPPNLVDIFGELENKNTTEWFVTSDPIDHKLGSGGGTVWLLDEWQRTHPDADMKMKKILLHAGGQSRRLPAYAPSGKILTPIPVFRWERGQRLGQNLLSLQLPLYEKIMSQSPESLRTLIASGDVYIRAEQPLQPIPEADVVCYGLWVDPVLATRHGVFLSHRQRPEELDFMLQKPSLDELERYSKTHLFLMDIGIWLLSDKAVSLLKKRSIDASGALKYYDLYADFGCSLGTHPTLHDEALKELSVAILPLPGGEFYHYGTSRELLSSTVAIQNKVCDQRQIMHRKLKPNPAIFTQNADVQITFTASNNHIWIENSHVPAGWKMGIRQIITGVPANDWRISMPDGVCLDIVPMKSGGWAVRPYGFDDAFRGDINNAQTHYLGTSFTTWLSQRGLTPAHVKGTSNDLQSARIFPIIHSVEAMEAVIRWMTYQPQLVEGKQRWLEAQCLSADDIASGADLSRLYEQRRRFSRGNLMALARNYEKSIFYQLDLEEVARLYHDNRLTSPEVLSDDAPVMQRIHNRMLRARIQQLSNHSSSTIDEQAAFALLRDTILAPITHRKSHPQLNVFSDQIVWGRSPVRIDVAGGWTDTPPYSLLAGGHVVNFAIELNGQPPLQVYIKPCVEPHILLRSIDMGAREVVTTYEELQNYRQIGSPFSIPKAALALAGFAPSFSAQVYPTLKAQLQAFGVGMEITLLSAIPTGSGLGTSSILAATVLGSLSDFCGLAWDKNEICARTLALEQLLTTGGGWQDQYGGVLQGIKLLQTQSGFVQNPLVHWLPEQLFTQPEYRDCHLLYYTGITRTAKSILAEIVRSMFLNSAPHLALLSDMKAHALAMAEAIQCNDIEAYGKLLGKSWMQNKALDQGTNPPQVEAIINKVKDYCLGYKLPGAGGGGYLYMVAKDSKAALRIREVLAEQAPNASARFVDMKLSERGFQVSRS